MRVNIDSHQYSSTAPIHPGYHIIETGILYEGNQLELIVKNTEADRRTTAQLNILNDTLTTMLDLRDGKSVPEPKLQEVIYQFNQEFPEMGFSDFLDAKEGKRVYETFTDKQWDHAEKAITRKEQLLMSNFTQNGIRLQEIMSDKGKVHEILREIIKQISEADNYTIRKTGQ